MVSKTGRHLALSVPPPVRVLHLYRRFRPDFTGDGIYYEQLIPLLNAAKSRHTILVYETVSANPPDTTTVGAGPVIYLEARSKPPLILLRWIWRHRKQYDVLHIHTHVDRYFLSYIAARAFGWRLIYSSTLSDTFQDLIQTYRPIYRPFTRRLFTFINMFVGISPRLLSIGALPPQRCRLIPQGVRLPPPVTPDIRNAIRKDLGLPPEAVVLLYLGSICERKGVDQLVKTFAELVPIRPSLRMMLIGPVLEPEYWSGIKDMIATHGLADKINHIEFDPSPARYYTAADIFVFPSIEEGFGNVLLEAMSHGLPVVSRYLDGVTEAFIEHGVNGLLFSSPKMFFQDLLTLVDNPELCKHVGGVARHTVQTKYDIAEIASKYATLYQELVRQPAHKTPAAPAPLPTVTRKVEELNFRPVVCGTRKPSLLAVIDTESEFDWAKGVAADHGEVRSIERLPQIQRLFEQYGVTPCYVVDYPVATGRASNAVIREIAARGAEIGAHLQPWTTPPHIEPIDDFHAFPGNLSLWLQRQKLSALCDAIEKNLGRRPRIFKAGRYGVGAETLVLLEEMGFDVDLSTAPGFDYRREGGPDFSRFSAKLSWFGQRRKLLEIPTTGGFTGLLRKDGAALYKSIDRPALKFLRLHGIMGRSRLLSRIRLSPEGHSLEDMKQISRIMIESGARFLTLSFHSSSLQPGFTPYCSSESDVGHMLAKLEGFLKYFLQELHGETTSPLALYARMQQIDRPHFQ